MELSLEFPHRFDPDPARFAFRLDHVRVSMPERIFVCIQDQSGQLDRELTSSGALRPGDQIGVREAAVRVSGSQPAEGFVSGQGHSLSFPELTFGFRPARLRVIPR